MLFRRMARPVRSFSGKNVFTSNTPSLAKGGDWICMISSPRSRLWPWLQALARMLDSRMCSRLWTGSMSFRPVRPSRAVTVPLICSLRASSLPCQGRLGTPSEVSTLRGTPAVEPGV